MSSIEEIWACIREKSMEREKAVKRILAGIEKKRKEMEKDTKKYVESF